VYDRAIAYHIQKGDYTAALSVLEQARCIMFAVACTLACSSARVIAFVGVKTILGAVR
jgi:hypothetical protein